MRGLGWIKILAFRYRIIWVTDAAISRAMGAVGTSDSDGLVFSFVTDSPDDVLRDTVLHEIIHALNYHLQLRDGPSDEEIASRLSTGLFTVFRDNPELARWLIENKI